MRVAVACQLVALWSLAATTALAQSDLEATANRTCVSLLSRIEASATRDVLAVSGESQGYHRVAFMPDPASNVAETGRYEQIMRFIADEDDFWDGQDTFVCDENRVLLYEFQPEVGSPAVERYEPPLPWLVLPLTTGLRWDWEGSVTIPSPDGPSRLEGRIAVQVGDVEAIETPAGVFEARPLEMHVSFQAEGEAMIRTVSWMRAEPGFGIIRRERYRPASATVPLWTWQLVAIEDVEAPSGAAAGHEPP